MKKLLSILLCLVGGWIPSSGQYIQAYLSANKVGVEDVLQYNLRVVGIASPSTPSFPNVPTFAKTKLFSQNSSSTQGGVTTYIQIYRPSQVGKYQIPSHTFKIGNRRYNSPAFDIEVMAADTLADSVRLDPSLYEQHEIETWLDVRYSKDTCYVGEQIEGEVLFFVEKNSRPYVSFEGKDILEVQQRFKHEAFWEEAIDYRRIEDYMDTVRGKEYFVFVLQRTFFFPIRSGRIVIRDVSFEAKEKLYPKNISEYDRLLNRGVKQKPLSVEAPFRPIYVMDLPQEANKRTNAVGDFEMIIRTDEEELRTGESFQFRVIVKGNGNIALVPRPDIHQPASFLLYEPISNYEFARTDSQLYGFKEFIYEMVPTLKGHYDLGPISFRFFNPETGRLDSIYKESHPVEVKGRDMSSLLKGEGIQQFYTEAFAKAQTKQLIKIPYLVPIASGLLFFVVLLIGLAFWKWNKLKV